MSRLIEDRDRRTKNRKKRKEAFDKAINLSALNFSGEKYRLSVSESNGSVRLLDEGAIVTASGDLDIYIMKGTIEKYLDGANRYLDNLTEDYVGTINMGHQDFATVPYGIVGSFTPSDLHLTDNGDGRHGLDVDLHITEEHPLIQALKVQGIDVGVSVEMYLHFDEEASKENDAWMVDEIFISDFAIVGECGNVGSSETISLKGGKEMKKEDITLTGTEEIKELKEEIEKVAEEVETDEITTEETTDESVQDEDEEEDEETVEESDSEEVEDEESDEESDDEEDEDEEAAEESVDALGLVTKMMARVEALESEVDELKRENAELKKSNRKKEKKLKAIKEADKEFTERFKGLSVSLGLTKDDSEEKQEVTERRYASGDGIGEMK